MGKQRSSSFSSSRAGLGQRAWRMLRLALLWARKGGVLKCRLMAELRHGAKYLKAGLHNNHHHDHKHTKGMIRYGERELSFDETPVVHLRMSRPNSLRFIIPCIKPHVVDFDYDFGDDDDDDDVDGCDGVNGRRSFLGCGAGDCDEVEGDDHQDQYQGWYENDDEGIDDKAEEFINRFYQQIKLQREISFQRRQRNAAIQVS